MCFGQHRHQISFRDFFVFAARRAAYAISQQGWIFAIAALALLMLAMPQRSAAQIVVNTTTQGVTSGQCSFQEALYATEFGNNIALDQTDPDDTYYTGCTDPSGLWYQIVLPGGTLTFDHFWDGDGHNPFGPTATPIIFSVVQIIGNGTTLEWTGEGHARLFAVGYASISPTSGVLTSGTYYGTGAPNLTLQNVYIKGFHVKGGNGTGGGGLGAGGAIYIGKLPSGGTPVLTIQNSTFDSNTATGGIGGYFTPGTNPGDGTTGAGGGLGGDGVGGGGGSRGNGGAGVANSAHTAFSGGGGGGTVFSGGDASADGNTGGAGGLYCGGNGGDSGNNGHDGKCPGGGGGEAGAEGNNPTGGNGNYGGGGGDGSCVGGNGGFGGGGGTGAYGGFGGGGGPGGSMGCNPTPPGGPGGPFGGEGIAGSGGGGGALGGAIFNDSGNVTVENSTFVSNTVTAGTGRGGNASGIDAGAAIFSRNGATMLVNVTISGNSSTQSGTGGGLVAYADGSSITLYVYDTIIANNGQTECYLAAHGNQLSTATVTSIGTGNLIMSNGSGTVGACPGVVTMTDPQLYPLQLNGPGNTPTMAILTSSAAANMADSGTSMGTDQRGVQRPQDGRYDIGAYEARPPNFLLSSIATITSDVDATGSATVTVNSFEYFNSPVTLSLSYPTAFGTLSLSSTSVTPPDNSSATSTLSFTLPASTPAGTYGVTVQGSSGSLSHSVPAKIAVTPTTAGITKVVSSFLTSGVINNSGVANSLTNKLSTAQSYLAAGDNHTAENVLAAMLNELNAQNGKHITASGASVLITDTRALKASVGANLTPDPVMGYVANSSNQPIAGATVNVLNPASAVVATAITDNTGSYFFPLTNGWTLGGSHTVQVTLPKGYKTSTPVSQKFTWQAMQVMLGNFVLN